jgi:hypothetical protein
MFYINKNYNVLFEGKHGVGKSAMVIDAFKKSGLKWAYFGGATMDPFIDFVGVPVKVNVDGQDHIELIMPKHIKPDELEAIFFDEYNRSHKKVRNATMELIQFKAINGRAFPKLRVIWAAINPEGDENEIYDIEPLDPAQKDRFHVHLEVPYKPDKNYFINKYGEEVGGAALQWWNQMGVEGQRAVSPRRLDYTIQMHLDGGDIKDVVSKISNPARLVELLSAGHGDFHLQNLKNKPDSEVKEWLKNHNNFDLVRSSITDKQYRKKFLPLLPSERLAALLSDDSQIKQYILRYMDKDKERSPYLPVLKEIVASNLDPRLVNYIKQRMEKAKIKIPAPADVTTYHAETEETTNLLDLFENRNKTRFMRKETYKGLLKYLPKDVNVTHGYIILELLAKISDSQMPQKMDDDYGFVIGMTNTILLSLLRKGERVEKINAWINGHAWLRDHLKRKGNPTINDLKRYVEENP